MTSNPKPHDPLRSLDGAEPPDRWDNVVARAESPADTMESPSLVAAGRHRPNPLLAAAAVLAVFALVAGIALAGRGGNSDQTQDVAVGPGEDPPTAIWGRTWQVTRIVRDGKVKPVIPAFPSGESAGNREPLRLDASRVGRLIFNGCNDAGGPVRLTGDRIERSNVFDSSNQGCLDGAGKADPVMAQDESLAKFLSSSIKVSVSGDDLTLTNDAGDEIDLVDEKALDPPTAIWGRTFTVTRLVDDGREMSPKASRGVPVHFRFRTVPDANYGIVDTIGQVGCANQNAVSVRGDILARETVELQNVPVCEFDVPEVATNGLLLGQPIIQLRGDKLVLRFGTSSIEAVDPTEPNPSESEEPPTAIWGRTWQVARIVRGGRDQPVWPGSADNDDGDGRHFVPLRLDATNTGLLGFNGCAGPGGKVRLDGDRIEAVGKWTIVDIGCIDAGGVESSLTSQDGDHTLFLRSQPRIMVSGDDLTLTNDAGDRVDLVDAKVFDPETAIWNRTWTVTSITEDGRSRKPVTSSKDPLTLAFSYPASMSLPELAPKVEPGMVTFRACNSVEIPLYLNGSVLERVGFDKSTLAGCPKGSDDSFLRELVGAGPSVEIRGDQLVLRSDTQSGGTRILNAVDRN